MIIYTDGIFDLFHYGHAEYLENIKKKYPNDILIVGVCNDRETYLYKGPTIMNEIERSNSVKHCKWVDKVLDKAPWYITPEFVEQYNIDLVCHNPGNYPNTITGEKDVYHYIKSIGKSMPITRTPNISTSEIIKRIFRQEEIFRKKINK